VGARAGGKGGREEETYRRWAGGPLGVPGRRAQGVDGPPLVERQRIDTVAVFVVCSAVGRPRLPILLLAVVEGVAEGLAEGAEALGGAVGEARKLKRYVSVQDVDGGEGSRGFG
jgi:hypothetical protein